MKTKQRKITTQSNSIQKIAMIVGFILLIPFLANIFVDSWNWGIGDFIVAGVLLFVTGLALDFTMKKLTNPVYRIITIIAIIAVFLLIWIDLAVGIFK